MASEKEIKVYTRRNKLTSEPSLTGKSADGGRVRGGVEVSFLQFFY